RRKPFLPRKLGEFTNDRGGDPLLAGDQPLLCKAEILVLTQHVLQRLRGREQRRLEPPVNPRPVEKLRPPFQPPHPEKQITERPEDQVCGQALPFGKQALAPSRRP